MRWPPLRPLSRMRGHRLRLKCSNRASASAGGEGRAAKWRQVGHSCRSGAHPGQALPALQRPGMHAAASSHMHRNTGPQPMHRRAPVAAQPSGPAATVAGRRSKTWRACGMTRDSTPRQEGCTRTRPAWLRQVRASRAFISAEAKLDSRTVWRYSAPRPLQGGQGAGRRCGGGGVGWGRRDPALMQRGTGRNTFKEVLLPLTATTASPPHPPTHPHTPPHLSAQSRTRIMSTPCPSRGMRFSASNTASGGRAGGRTRVSGQAGREGVGAMHPCDMDQLPPPQESTRRR